MIPYKIFRDSAENEVWKQKFKIIFILMQLSEMHGGFIMFSLVIKGKMRKK